MHEMKKMMDPNGILNPYKVLYPMWKKRKNKNLEQILSRTKKVG